MNTRHAQHLVVARVGDATASAVEIVSTRDTTCGPFTFRRILNRGEVGVLRFHLTFEGTTIPMVMRYSETTQIMIPIGELVWVLVPVPGRNNAKEKAGRWNGELFALPPTPSWL